MSNRIVARPYQIEAVEKLRAASLECRRLLFVLPTGGGKTVIAAMIASGAYAKGRRMMFLVHRVELVEQASRAFTEAGIPHGKITAGCELTDEPVQIASVQTLVRRLDRVTPPNLIFIDEGHHAVAGSWLTVLNAWPGALVIGLTATPERLDGRGLGGAYQTLIQGPTCRNLIDAGYLSRFRAFAPPPPDLSRVRVSMGEFNQGDLGRAMSDRAVIGDIVETYQRLAAGKRAIMFASSIEHSRQLVDAFCAAGVEARHVDGDTGKDWRKAATEAFASGDVRVLSNCDLFGEGFDVPAAEVVILARPTQSLGLHLQQIGRVLRPAPGKPEALILDHAGNIARHGFPDAERRWSLDAKAKAKQGPESTLPAVRTCPACYACHRPALVCPECGHDYEPKRRVVEFQAGDLVEVQSAAQREANRKADRVAFDRPAKKRYEMNYDELVADARAKGMKNPGGWAYHVMAGRRAKRGRAA